MTEAIDKLRALRDRHRGIDEIQEDRIAVYFRLLDAALKNTTDTGLIGHAADEFMLMQVAVKRDESRVASFKHRATRNYVQLQVWFTGDAKEFNLIVPREDTMFLRGEFGESERRSAC
uniref:Uncharacterized protein n=1 Tax=viral metagenome TaxID=1070528 RepID=A0A6M3LVI6_9ZZZZ